MAQIWSALESVGNGLGGLCIVHFPLRNARPYEDWYRYEQYLWASEVSLLIQYSDWIERETLHISYGFAN
jgi:hypothetical protein